MLTVRAIEPAEWGRLDVIYKSQGDRLPPAEQNLAIIAEDEQRIVGMCGVNLIAHVGPLWVDPVFRRQGLASRLVTEAGALVQGMGGRGFLMFPSNSGSSAVARKLGLTKAEWEVFRMEF